MCLGVPGKIETLLGGSPSFGSVAFGGVTREVCLAYVPEARIGDYVIVHVGFAISVLDAEEARHTLDLLATLAAGDEADGQDAVPRDPEAQP